VKWRGKETRIEGGAKGEDLITFRSPAVVFAGHPSLRFGEALDLLNSWKHDKKNSLILIGILSFLDSKICEKGFYFCVQSNSGTYGR
jgi:hypothetical protein